MNNITANKFYDILVAASNSLNESKEYLNSLNVFPVPDGDTGTNMSATFTEAVKSISEIDKSTVSGIAAKLSKGALMGARGNSGVILSQILRGFSKGIDSASEITVPVLVAALNNACDSAYKAVMKPKEGTILTVIRAASESATLNSSKDNLLDFLDCVLVDTKNMLNATREMLPENKSAGTVDAGGAGLVVILQSFSDVLHGRVDLSSFDFNDKKINVEFVDVHPNFEDITFQYCTEFIIKSFVDEDTLRNRLDSLGDSIVVVSMDDITKVHIHTNEPGTAFNIAMEYGDLTRMKVDNMKEQADANPTNSSKHTSPKIKQAVIAVASGKGIEKMFLDAGATHVISGGQSMNPSVENIVEAINLVNAENVIILPNNKNIILSAEQAANIVDCNVLVVKSRTIPQGISACISFNSDSDFESNYEEMSEVIKEVSTCQITTAVKDSTMNGLNIKEGELIGILEDSIIMNSTSYTETILSLFDKCVSSDTSLVTVIYGNEIHEEFVKKITSKLEDKYEDIDICFVNGEQEVYQFIISFE